MEGSHYETKKREDCDSVIEYCDTGIMGKHFKLVDPWQDSRLWQSRGDRSTGADGEYVASLFCKRGL